jgi:uncharacterized BrkB/YihY/UPF0761 family membrane protein
MTLVLRTPEDFRIARRHRRMLTMAVAVVVPIIVWALASAAGAEFVVVNPLIGTLEIDWPLLIVSTLPIALASWGVLALLERLTPRARTIWTIIAVVALALSVVPIAFVDTSDSTRVALGIIHVATGLFLIRMLRHGARNW